jgi:hypothetical protein
VVASLQPAARLHKIEMKETDFAEAMISKVLRNLHSSRYPSLKSAD